MGFPGAAIQIHLDLGGSRVPVGPHEIAKGLKSCLAPEYRRRKMAPGTAVTSSHRPDLKTKGKESLLPKNGKLRKRGKINHHS